VFNGDVLLYKMASQNSLLSHISTFLYEWKRDATSVNQ